MLFSRTGIKSIQFPLSENVVDDNLECFNPNGNEFTFRKHSISTPLHIHIRSFHLQEINNLAVYNSVQQEKHVNFTKQNFSFTSDSIRLNK